MHALEAQNQIYDHVTQVVDSQSDVPVSNAARRLG